MSLPLAGEVKPGWLDLLVFGWTVWTIFSRFNLLKDYRRNVVTRLGALVDKPSGLYDQLQGILGPPKRWPRHGSDLGRGGRTSQAR